MSISVEHSLDQEISRHKRSSIISRTLGVLAYGGAGINFAATYFETTELNPSSGEFLKHLAYGGMLLVAGVNCNSNARVSEGVQAQLTAAKILQSHNTQPVQPPTSSGRI